MKLEELGISDISALWADTQREELIKVYEKLIAPYDHHKIAAIMAELVIHITSSNIRDAVKDGFNAQLVAQLAQAQGVAQGVASESNDSV